MMAYIDEKSNLLQRIATVLNVEADYLEHPHEERHDLRVRSSYLDTKEIMTLFMILRTHTARMNALTHLRNLVREERQVGMSPEKAEA